MGKSSTIKVCSLYQAFQVFSRFPNYFAMSLWSEFSHMDTVWCKGEWEIKLLALPTSIVKVVKDETWLAK